MADLGATLAAECIQRLRDVVYDKSLRGDEAVKQALRDILKEKLNVGEPALKLDTKPSVVLVIGVNGVGKTTSIGKMGARMQRSGKKVLFCAADTFRAAAADQLEIWAQRSGAEIVRQMRAQIPAASCSTVLWQPRPAVRMLLSATPQADSITRQIS